MITRGNTEFKNPHHPEPDYVVRGFELRHQDQEADFRYRMRKAEIGRPSEEQREYAARIRAAEARSQGVDPEEQQKKVHAWNEKRVAELRDHVEQEGAREYLIDISHILNGIDFTDFDPTFWFASGKMVPEPPFVGEWPPSDTLHITGKETWSEGRLHQRYFGARVRFELQPRRMPDAPTGRYRSDPTMGLVGGVTGYVGDGDYLSGDRWSNCWLHRKQTMYQFGFAAPGDDNRKIIAISEAPAETIFFIERTLADDSVLDFHTFSGQFPMPSVTFTRNDIVPTQSIWVELELMFHVQLEGNSLFWIDRELLLQVFQWPLIGS
ncbi:hypothetical protein ACIPW5_29430 [Streptomyces sp. NPDC090077]|uniref:hypothetical protein n=1 Tax=Streptomyces sp. NPDC090077 TaxID=3365938 RepID=UPI00380EEDD7